MTTRIYSVTFGSSVRLIRAANPAQALRYVANSAFKVQVASQDDLVQAVSGGVKVEEASEEEQGS